ALSQSDCSYNTTDENATSLTPGTYSPD
ncbi:signal peptidase I domain protein, partial [Chlamydia psittaci 06-1683]